MSRRYRIVVALDLSELSEIVLEHAIDQAARHAMPDLHFVTVQEHGDTPSEDVKGRLATLVFEGLESFRRDRPEWRARLHVRTGKPAEEILELADEISADLIVVGSFGAHGRHRKLGHTAAKVVEQASCPTLVIGLTERAAEPEVTCAECVAIREETDGERWFCDQHVAPERMGLATTLLPFGSAFTGSGPMW